MSKQYKRTKEYIQEFVEGFQSEMPTSKKFMNLEGKVFGELKVIKFKDTKREHTNWFCKCSCGRIVVKKTNQLNRGVKSCTVCSFQKIKDDNKVSKDINYYKVTLRFPHLKLIDAKDGETKTAWLWYCPLCNTPFHKSPYNLLHKETHSCRCNTKTFNGWSKQLREHQIKDVCKDKGLKFLGWKDDYLNNKSVVFVKCDFHQHYPINVNNLTHRKADYGCPICAEESRGDRTKHTLDKFLEDSKNVHGDLFDYSQYEYICSRTPSKIICTICDGTFKASYDNHVNKGRGCPHCKGKNQKELYLLRVIDNGTDIALKYGIAVDTNRRIKEHIKNTGYDFELVSIIVFDESYMCRDSENFIKKKYGKGYLSKDLFKKGYTETVCCSKLEDILIDFKNINEGI